MITANDIFEYLNSVAPFGTQCDWDNSGILIGEKECEINKIAVCLDITDETVEVAFKRGAQLIVSHHPVIFAGLKAIEPGSVVEKLIRKKITAISLHTPFDKACDGVNDVLSRTLGLKNISRIAHDGDEAMLRKGTVDEISPAEFAEKIKLSLGGSVKYNIGGKSIRKVAVCGGAGADFLDLVCESECDALVTADVKHHQFLLAQSKGVTIFDAGHYETENVAMMYLSEKLQKKYKTIDIAFIDNKPIETV